MTRAAQLTSFVAGALLAGILLAGCAPEAPEGRGESTPRPASGLPEGVTSDTDVPQDVPNDLQLRKQVTVTSCEQTDTGWEARGTFANPASDEVTATISIFFTTESATVLADSSVEATVAAGATEDWVVSADFTPAPDMVCVLRGVG